MPYFISRPTSRELRENLRASARGDSRIRGVARTTEEAHDIERRMSREGEEFTKPYLVSGEAKESYQARIDLARRSNIPHVMADPEKALREGLF